MSIVRWLHISDLHYNDSDMSSTMLRRELPVFLRENNLKSDYIFCTGDIKSAGAAKGGYPDEAVTYLRELCDSAGASVDRLFIVPGNHDINRAAIGRDEAIHRVHHQNEGYYDSKYGSINEEDLVAIHVGQEEFREFLSMVYRDAPDRVTNYNNPLKPHFVIETPDLNVLHVDSTLVNTNGQERTELIVGTEALMHALDDINEDKPTVLITHFPFFILNQDERVYVSTLLRKKNVALWLAGHEHDFNTQPIKYIHSLQAGELRMEEKANAAVLIGELDTTTLRVTVTSYAWFREGWAKYPILWDDGEHKDEYHLSLNLSRKDGKSRLAVKASEANSRFFDKLPKTVIENIIPDIRVGGLKSHNQLDEILNEIWNTSNPHLILLADGGMGKTTMLLYYCKKSDQTVLYIPVEKLAALDLSIKEYCVASLFEGDRAAFSEFVQGKDSRPSLILLIDGINELSAQEERNYVNEIGRLSFFNGLQFVVTSRSDFTVRRGIDDVRNGELVSLTDDQINSTLSTAEWNSISGTDISNLLRNPMMLTMYKEVSPIIEKHREEEYLEWALPMRSSTDLLHNYYSAQMAVLLDRSNITGGDLLTAYQILMQILPEIGYRFELDYRLNMKNSQFREMVLNLMEHYTPDSKLLMPIQEQFRVYESNTPNTVHVIDLLTDGMHLLYKDHQLTSFPHQMHRDYLSACYIVSNSESAEQIDELWNRRGIPFSVMKHIQNLSGHYWSDIAERIHDAGKGRQDAWHLVGNLIDCFPYSEEGGVPDYSGLDLRRIQIPYVHGLPTSKKISLSSAWIDNTSLGDKAERPRVYSQLTFSNNNDYLSAATDGKVYIYDVIRHADPFIFDVGRGVSNFTYADGYLFAVLNGTKSAVAVFLYDDDRWSYSGTIEHRDGAHDLFNRRLKTIILHDDKIHFYYNNRIIAFDLTNCEMLYNKAKQHAWEHAIDGIDITRLSEKRKYKRPKRSGVSWRTVHKGMTATSYTDGRLTIDYKNKLYRILARGTNTIKSGAVSGDGTKAATLSSKEIDGKRFVQLWDLDAKKRTGDLLCPLNIEKIHLSETGRWLFGETEQDTWLFDTQTRKEHTFANEYLISNQRGKLITYGDRVIRKDGNNLIYLYDLETGEIINLENPCKNARIVGFMPDNTVTMVGNNANKAYYTNIRSHEVESIDTGNNAIIGLNAFSKHPFIAISTSNNEISIYHTGDGMRKRILQPEAGNYITIVSPSNTVIACTGGLRSFQTFNYYEKEIHGRRCGWWYENLYGSEGDPPTKGDVKDIAFNAQNGELVIILTNGEIIYCHEKYCRYHGTTKVITNFNVGAYDFTDCKCSETIKRVLYQNGAEIDKDIYIALTCDDIAAARTADRIKLHLEHGDKSPDIMRLEEFFKVSLDNDAQKQMIERYDTCIRRGQTPSEAWEEVLSPLLRKQSVF